MQPSVCQSCRSVLRVRLRQQIQHLQNVRRDQSSGASSQPLESWYWETSPPSPKNLAAAKWFFDVHPPRKLWTANEWRSHGQREESQALTPEVAFLGRSNAGKSSLLNALLNAPSLNKVGSTPGKTKVLHAYGLSATIPSKKTKDKQNKSADAAKNLVTVLDAPGYGHASQGDWGDSIINYLKERKHLRRVFLLISAHHGLKPADSKMLDLLRSYAVPHQLIVTKCDRLEPLSQRRHLLQATMQKIQKALQPDYPHHAVAALGEALAVGWLGDGMLNAKVRPNQMQGVSAVQWAVLRAAGLEGYAATFNGLDEGIQRKYHALAQPGAASEPESLNCFAEAPSLSSAGEVSPPSASDIEQHLQREEQEEGEVDEQPDDTPSYDKVTTGIDDFLYVMGALETPNQPSRHIPYSANKTTRRRRQKELKRKILKSQFPVAAPRRRSGSDISAMAQAGVMTGRLDALLPAAALKEAEPQTDPAVREGANETVNEKAKAGKSRHANPFKNTGAMSLFGG
jgi:GTP-binding protein